MSRRRTNLCAPEGCKDSLAWRLAICYQENFFQRNKSTISRHIRNVFESGELASDSVVAFFATVQREGDRSVERTLCYYNLDVIISVGYRVKSLRGVQFRIWATRILKEYLTKGFALNDDLLKQAGGGNYFDELLARIRDIRSSEFPEIIRQGATHTRRGRLRRNCPGKSSCGVR